MNDQPHIVVIGAGLAGLTSAALLTREGRRVTVLEQREPGGRARSIGPEGFAVNFGPHALAMKGPGTAVLEDLGIDLSGGNPLSRPPRVVVGGEVRTLMDRAGGAPGLRGMRALPGFRDILAGTSDGTVAEVLDGITDDVPTRSLLSAVARLGLYADAEDVAAADVLAEASRGGAVRYLDGGWQRLVDQLLAAAGGAEFRRGAADRIEIVDGRPVGVLTKAGEWLPADGVVVATGGPADVADLLDGDLAEEMRAHASVVTPARMAVLDLAIRGPVDKVGVILGMDAPIYLAEHSRYAKLTDGDDTVLHAARFLPVGESGTPEMRGELERLVDLAAPGWRERVVKARFLPAITVTHDLPSRTRGGLSGRHPGTIDGAGNLAIAGDWVGPVGTLAQAAIASAARAAEVVQTVGVRREQVA
jgi:phytoene dehydrogenase-like protein